MTAILITGAGGQLGQELTHLLDQRGVAYDAFGSRELDITDAAAVTDRIGNLKPRVIYHCAAFTAVDRAEDSAKDLNWRVNVDGTANVARAAKQVGATMVYVSTDYVFDGTQETPYQVTDQPNPKNEYGRAKLAGEQAVQSLLTDYYIVRTSWVFGQYGKNFVFTMRRLAQDHDRLTVVADQVGRPTWTRTLAEFMTHLVDRGAPFGTYQLSNTGVASWYDFARAILAKQAVTVAPVTSAEYPQKAYRPRHAVMDLTKAQATGFAIPSWQAALAEFLAGLD